MSIELTERTVGMWFMNLTDTSDFLGGLQATDDGYQFNYRFRYYKDGDAWTGKDEKHWYTVKIKNTMAKAMVIQNVQLIVRELERVSGQQCDELLVRNGDTSAFMEELATKPWAHMRVEKNGSRKG